MLQWNINDTRMNLAMFRTRPTWCRFHDKSFTDISFTYKSFRTIHSPDISFTDNPSTRLFVNPPICSPDNDDISTMTTYRQWRQIVHQLLVHRPVHLHLVYFTRNRSVGWTNSRVNKLSVERIVLWREYRLNEMSVNDLPCSLRCVPTLDSSF